MLVTAGSIRIRPGAHETARAALADLLPATRAEEGCRAYTFAWDVDDGDLLRIYEEWDDEAALAAHLETEHVGVFNEAIGPVLAGRPELEVHHVARSRPFFDD